VVGGTLLVEEGRILPDIFPGRAVLGPGKAHVETAGEDTGTPGVAAGVRP